MSADRPRALLSLLLALAACASPRPATPAVPEAEKPQVEVVFEGNASFSASRLRGVIAGELADFERRGFAKASIDDAAYALETFHLGEGFPFARVEYALETPAGEPPRALFRIEEGPRTILESVRIEGNSAFAEEVLLQFFQGTRAGVFSTGPIVFVRAEVEAAAGAIARQYVENGFLDVDISEPEVTFGEDRSRASVVVRVAEGVRYTLSDVHLEGDLLYPEEEVRKVCRQAIGAPYLPRVAYELRARIQEFYGERGHPDFRCEFREAFDAETGNVALSFRIEPGPKVTVSEIRVEGNESTRTGFVLSRLKLRAGETYSTKRERESFRELFRTGLFETVEIRLEEGEGTDRELVVRVKEAPSIEFFVEPGYGSYDLARMRAGFREKNLFGTGRILRTDVTGAIRAQRAVVGVTDPWFLGTSLAADFPVFFHRREEPSFTRVEWGGGANFKRAWTERFETTLGYEFRRSEAKNVDVVDPVVLQEVDVVDISALKFSPSFDSRNDLFVPSRGYYGRVSLEWADGAIGSELDYFRTQVAQALYVPVTETTVAAGSVRTGAIFPIHGTETIPIQERFFNGGENTVRSFTQDDLGPKDADDNPIGGEAFTVLSIEVRQKLFDRLEAGVFYDTGNVAPEISDYIDFEGFRAGVGAGLRYLLPIGPVRIDAAWNPNPRDDEDRFVLHFSVGMAF